MIVDYKILSEFSKVFIYPSSRKFYKDEAPEISDKIEYFLNDFEGVDSFFEIKYQRFIVILISEKTPLTIEQNDQLVGFIIGLEQKYNISLLDKVNVCFKQGEYVQLKEITDFKKLIKNRGVSKNTIVFNHFINIKQEYENEWEMPASDSWVSYMF
ncbi:MAG: ABC transporter ATPase [Flavobacteriaceae bacterium]|nr:ABC transporter ATPase [Flavobacteriaceae bacterium]